MTMDNCISESIYAFPIVQPSSQPQDLQDAIDSLLVRIDALEGENRALKVKLETLGMDLATLSENQLIQLRLINELRKKPENSRTTHERAEKIDGYMEARPDHKASYDALRGFLDVSDVLLHRTIKALMVLYPGKYGITKDKEDKRKKWFIMVPKIS